MLAVADGGERPRGPPSPLIFWVKNRNITEGRNNGRANQKKKKTGSLDTEYILR